MQRQPNSRQEARTPGPARPGSSAAATAEALRFCARTVAENDPERYAAAVLAPAAARGDLLAILAFNSELARTREMVSEPMPGEIRLQWWREGIAGVFAGSPREHPVLLGLAAAVARRPLSRPHFEAIVEARVGDLYDEQFRDVGDLVRYGEATAARPLYLLLEALGVSALQAHVAARHVGVAWALVGLMRALPFHAARRRLYLPTGLLAASDIAPETIYRGARPPGLAGLVAVVVAEAERHLREARSLSGQVPRAALPALAIARLADGHVAALNRVGFDPFLLPAVSGGFMRPLRLALTLLSGRF